MNPLPAPLPGRPVPPVRSVAAPLAESITCQLRRVHEGDEAALRAVLTDKPGHLTARLYEGICLLELGRPAEARAAFAPIAEGTSALQADALWYLALSYLRENDPTRCRETLLRLQAGQEHYQQAQELLRALGR